MQGGRGRRTDAGGIPEPYRIGVSCQIKIDLPTDEFRVPSKTNAPTTCLCSETLDRDLILVENQRPI